MLAQPRRFFEALHDNFASGDRIVVLLVERDEELLAGVLFLVWKDTLFYKFNASRDTADRPNDLLVWSGLELARELGLRFVDFGLSDTDQPGLVRFKSKFADEQRDISTLSWWPSAAPSRTNGSLLSELTEMLTDPSVPDDITIRGGEVLYRYFA
jgi:CelD/BcsL family acetyltransferase involved in cellulose biosynthesis